MFSFMALAINDLRYLTIIPVTILIFSLTSNGIFAQESYRANLVGESEVPPIFSESNGTAIIAGNASKLMFQINVTSLDKITGAYLYLGNPTENGEIVFTLFNSTEPTDFTNGTLVQGTVNPSFLGPLTGKNLTSLIEFINQNLIYINVHTSKYPDGELRGTLKLTVPQTVTQITNGLVIYDNPLVGIKLSYPSDWIDLDLTDKCRDKTPAALQCYVSFSSLKGDSFGHLFIRINFPEEDLEWSQKCNCQNLTELVKYEYKISQDPSKDFTFINDSQTTVSKYPAWQFEYNTSELTDEFKLKSSYYLKMLTIVNNTYYTIGFSTPTNTYYQTQLPVVKKVIDSIEFVPPEKPVTKTPSFLKSNGNESTVQGPADDLPTNNSMNSGSIKILSSNDFIDSIGYLHVVGEIKNNSPTNISFVKITATFYDSSNEVVATDFTYTNPTDISPGQKAPFELILTSASIPISQIDHYNLAESYQ